MQRKIQVTSIFEFLRSQDGFDCVIDVRSPSEYADDRIPGAINLPVLDDDERAEVGTIYKQVDPFTARKRGATLTSRNIATHIEALSHHPKEWRPIVYCWRGGQRSGSMALVMHEIGWPVTLVQGGYKAYRRHVQEQLDTLLPLLNLVVIAGPTGCGKTDLLHQLRERGHQVIDLEGLASHRGSLLGQEPNTHQPSQKLFESRLYDTLARLDLHKPIFVESESSKIGEIHLPNALFQNLITSRAIALNCDRSKRAHYLVEKYWHLTQSSDHTIELIRRLGFRHGKTQITEWIDLINKGRWFDLAESLLASHYDPSYERSQKRLTESAQCRLVQPGIPESMVVFDELAG
jgi:tRNA 2-selenouridine synthase